MRHPCLNLLTVLITLLTTGIYLWYEKNHPGNRLDRSIRGWSSRAIPFVVDNRTGSIALQSDQFRAWLDKHTNSSQALAIQNVIRQTLCQFQKNTTTTTSGMHIDQSCCNEPAPTGYALGVNCQTSLGSLPTVTGLDPTKPHIPTDPPNYQHTQIYVNSTEEPNTQIKFTCSINLEKRKVVYELLLHWVRLAEKHNLIWWLNYGSLLGAVRNGDFIPYDHDADISVLGSAEPTIRRLATGWQNLSFDKINLITREQDYCVHDHMPRLNCQGIPVRYQMDPCAFCTPLARLVSGYFDYIDIFLVNVELRIDARGNPVDMGMMDEALERDRGSILSYPLDHIFPLTTCNYMGLKLPCPRNSHAVLAHTYGEQYMRPAKLCNPRSGHWYNA